MVVRETLMHVTSSSRKLVATPSMYRVSGSTNHIVEMAAIRLPPDRPTIISFHMDIYGQYPITLVSSKVRITSGKKLQLKHLQVEKTEKNSA